MTISFLSTPPKPSSIVPHLFSRFFFLFVALIFFLSPRQRAPVAPRPLPTTPSAQRRPPEMALRVPKAAHSPHYDVRHCCSSARRAASAPPAASLSLRPTLPLPRPPPLLLRHTSKWSDLATRWSPTLIVAQLCLIGRTPLGLPARPPLGEKKGAKEEEEE